MAEHHGPELDPTAEGATWRVTAPTALEAGSDHKRTIDLDPGTLIRVERSTWGHDYRLSCQVETVHLRVLDGRAAGESLVVRGHEDFHPLPPSGLELVDAWADHETD